MRRMKLTLRSFDQAPLMEKTTGTHSPKHADIIDMHHGHRLFGARSSESCSVFRYYKTIILDRTKEKPDPQKLMINHIVTSC